MQYYYKCSANISCYEDITNFIANYEKHNFIRLVCMRGVKLKGEVMTTQMYVSVY